MVLGRTGCRKVGMTGQSDNDDLQASFEVLLAQVLTTDEKAQEHEALKKARGSARRQAVAAKASFERNRDRPAKPRKRRPRRQG